MNYHALCRESHLRHSTQAGRANSIRFCNDPHVAVGRDQENGFVWIGFRYLLRGSYDLQIAFVVQPFYVFGGRVRRPLEPEILTLIAFDFPAGIPGTEGLIFVIACLVPV